MTVISNFCDKPPEPIDDFKKDLEFAYQTLLENHPGIHDSWNPNFSNELTKSYQLAQEQLGRAYSTEDKTLVT